VYDRIFGDFPANNPKYTPYIYIWFRPALVPAKKLARNNTKKKLHVEIWAGGALLYMVLASLGFGQKIS
jgi:hypothetical protein